MITSPSPPPAVTPPPAATSFRTPDGRVLEPSAPSTAAPLATPTGSTSLAAAGLDAGEYALFTNVNNDGAAWQISGTPLFDEAVAVPGSFKDAVSAARDLSAKRYLGRSWAEPTFAIVAGAGPEQARQAVPLRGFLKPDHLLGTANVAETFVSEVRPDIEALVSKSRWIDLRTDTPGAVHEPAKLRKLPFIGVLV